MTAAWVVRFCTLIPQAITDNFVVWRTLQNNADWDCSKTQILRENSKTQSQHQEGFCAFSEVELLSQSSGCARSRQQPHTVQRSLKLFHWTPDYAWTGSPFRIYGTWQLRFYTPSPSLSASLSPGRPVSSSESRAPMRSQCESERSRNIPCRKNSI